MPIYVSLWLYSQSYNPMIYIYSHDHIIAITIAIPSRHAPRAKRQTRELSKVPLDPFEKDASRELDTFKERLGAWRVPGPKKCGVCEETLGDGMF
jgi:hypothetical protein